MSENQIQILIDKLRTGSQELGLHAKEISVLGQPTPEVIEKILREAEENGEDEPLIIASEDLVGDVKAGKMQAAISVTFATADLAWSDRVLYPDRFDIDVQAAALIPSKSEMLREEINRQIESGVEIGDIVIPKEYL